MYMSWRQLPYDYESIPHWSTYVWKSLVCLMMEDTWHYFAHRALHDTRVYPHVHKVHHTYTAPFGIVAEYAHPVETLVLGMGFFWPLLLLCDHMLFMFVWFMVRQIQTHEAHIGYEFPYNPLYLLPFYGGARAHDLHHKSFNCNYASTFTWWDRIFGTYVDPHSAAGTAQRAALRAAPRAGALGNADPNADVNKPLPTTTSAAAATSPVRAKSTAVKRK